MYWVANDLVSCSVLAAVVVSICSERLTRSAPHFARRSLMASASLVDRAQSAQAEDNEEPPWSGRLHPERLGACPTLTPGPPCQEPPTRV